MKEKKHDRFNMLFSYDNAYGIYRAKENGCKYPESVNYELISFFRHQSINSYDVLKDLTYYMRSGQLQLNSNDIVCIKVNGLVVSYKYIKKRTEKTVDIFENYLEITNFLESERRKYISNLHRERKVLDLIDGKSYFLDEIDLSKHCFFCIDKEVFRNPKRRGIMANYFLYMLSEGEIINVNPYSIPFTMIAQTVFYFNKIRKEKYRDAILLWNKSELELVNDYCQLKHVVV